MVTTENRLGGRTWASLIVFGFFGQLAWAVENMYLNVFLYNTISGNTSYIAAMVAASAAAATLTTLAMGALSDTLGKRKIFITAGYIIWGFSVISFAFISPKTAALLFPGRDPVKTAAVLVIIMDCIMTFFGSTANDASFNAWVTDNTKKENRGRAEAVLAVMPLAAILVIFGGLDWLTAQGKWNIFFLTAGVITSAAGFTGFFLISDNKTVKSQNTVSFGTSLIQMFKPSMIKKNSQLYITLTALLIYASSFQIFMPYLIIYIQKYLGIKNYVPVLGAVLILSSVISASMGSVIDKFGKIRFFFPAAAAECAGLAGMFFARSPAAVTAAGTVMLAGSMLASAALAGLVRDYTPEGQAGGFQGIRMIFHVLLPMIIGPWIGSFVIRSSGLTYTELGIIKQVPTPHIFTAAALLLLFTALPVIALLKSDKKRHTL